MKSEKTISAWPKSVFGEKLTAHSGIVELMDDLGEALTKGRGKMQMMGGGNPAHIPEMQAIWRKRMADLLENAPDEFDRVMADYDQPAGSPVFLEAMANFLNREFDWGLSADNVAVTNGAQTALFFLLNRFAGGMSDGKAKRILLPVVPEYVGYADLAVGNENLFDARKPKIETVDERTFKYRIDFDRLNLDESHGAIVVSRPTNPSSNVLTDNEVAKLRSVATEHGIPLIIDNAYGLPFPGVIFGEATPVWDENIILTLSLSKLGLPGLRTGLVIAREEIIQEIRSMTAIVGLANNNVGQSIARGLIESGEIRRLSEEVVRPFYQERSEQAIAWAHRYLPENVPWRIHRSEGAFFLWIWFEELPISSRELYLRLKEENLIIVPGEYFFFGIDSTDWPHSRECIRVSYTQSPAVVEAGFKILGQVIRELWARK